MTAPPPEQIPRIGYVPIAISKSSKQPDLAQQFIDFVSSDEGKAVYAKWRYLTSEEEAHRFAPARETVSSSSITRTLAAEGRKFGVCLVVVSQRPNRLDSTVLSQCVTNIVMKV